MTQCPCGSTKNYDKCCGMYLEKEIVPPTAEALMRSRYCAYTMGKVDYILNTHNPDDKDDLSREEVENWSKNSEWLGLEIVKASKGKEKDQKGTVEFKAHFMQDRARYTHHEIALFEKKNNQWFFMDGQVQNKPHIRETPKVGRNDPCPCGSGKKYKKCCG